MLWLIHHNPEIDWRTGKVKITRCPEKCGKQWRPKKRKSGWEKQKEEEKKRKRERNKRKKSKKRKKRKNQEKKEQWK